MLFNALGSPVFNSIFTAVQTSEIVGPALVNLGSMVIPRTAVDYSRNKQAGKETGRREVMSFTNSTFMLAVHSYWLGKFLGKASGINASLNTDSNTMNVITKSWLATPNNINKTDAKTIKNYAKQILEGATCLDGETARALSAKERTLLSDSIVNLIKKEKPLKKLASNVIKEIGVSNIKIIEKNGNDRVEVISSVKRLIKDSTDLYNQVFKLHDPSPDNLNQIIGKMKGAGQTKAALAMSLVAATGFSIQFLNKYLTKKETGSTMFVGLPEYNKPQEQKPQKKDINRELIIKKTASILGISYIASAAITGRIKPSQILPELSREKLIPKLEFKGSFPTLNQLKAIFGVTIVGRILASRDENELRETNIRDMPAFLNWLVLGGFVSRLSAFGLAKTDLLHTKGSFPGKGLFKKLAHVIMKSELKNHDELEKMANNKALKGKLNLSLLAGMLYSGVTLGAFIPILNKNITNKLAAYPPHENSLLKAAKQQLGYA